MYEFRVSDSSAKVKKNCDSSKINEIYFMN
jgi:hypothetical protein